MSDVSKSLILLTKNERFAQVAQRKWAIVSESLRLLTKNERMSESLIFLSESLIFGQKTSDLLGNQMSEFPALLEWYYVYSDVFGPLRATRGNTQADPEDAKR